MKESRYLVAVTLSEHASLKITDYRKKVFREFGAVSALALPPLIPLAWFYGRPIAENVPYLKGSEGAFSVGPAVREADALFLPILPDSALTKVLNWQKLFPSNKHPDISLLFPVYPGIYICSDKTFNLSTDSALENLTINDFRLTCFILEYSSEKKWWEDLFYSQLWSKRVKNGDGRQETGNGEKAKIR